MLWRVMIFTYHWQHCNQTFKSLQALVWPKEHTEYNVSYYKDIFTFISKQRVIPEQNI